MAESDNKSSFDKLVAGLSSDDRRAMLERINQKIENPVQLSQAGQNTQEPQLTLQKKLQQESVLYRLLLWIRSVFTKQNYQKLYCDDVLLATAKKINRNHPGLINYNINSFDYLFHERLQHLKEASDFFKPYFNFIEDNISDFHVFLSSFVAPQLSDKINEEADPFITPFDRDANNELRLSFLKKLDEILNNMQPQTRESIYLGVSAANWLRNFTMLPYLHFLSGFTNVTGDVFSCPYKAAMVDYNMLASVFDQIIPIPSEVLQAIFLFSQKKSLSDSVLEKDVEKQISEFMQKAEIHLEEIKSFIETVPIRNLGRIVNNNYDWVPDPMGGVEAWFPGFRMQWKKILDIRWAEWVKEQKKQNLGIAFKNDFGLSDFPVLEQRPWLKLWTIINFGCELSAGFLGWIATDCFDDMMALLLGVITEGIFFKSENRSEFSDALDNFNLSMTRTRNLIQKLSPEGEFGKIFQDFSTARIHTFQVQKQIDSMMKQTESEFKENLLLFCKSARAIDAVFHGIFDEEKDGIHEGLQNLNSIKGRNNRKFLDDLIDVRKKLIRAVFYLAEMETIDNVRE
ncbi:MAG: DUF5312 domain-containing protein [Treponema sp.]|nr:DUF5312 domain-containing protein [Treponema sp.]